MLYTKFLALLMSPAQNINLDIFSDPNIYKIVKYPLKKFMFLDSKKLKMLPIDVPIDVAIEHRRQLFFDNQIFIYILLISFRLQWSRRSLVFVSVS